MKKKSNKRLVRKPSFFAYYFVAPLLILYYRLIVKFRRNKIKIRKNSLVIAPHRGYFDFVTVPLAIYPVRAHNVATSYWFRNKKLGKFLRFMGCIRKDQYKSDILAIKEMSDCFKHGDTVLMFPEGQMSPDGTSQILAPGLDRLIKKYKPNVYFVNTNGAYLIGPKWHLKIGRGVVDVKTDLIIKEEDIDNLSQDEILTIINNKFKENDDLTWVKSHPEYKYKSKTKAEGLGKIVYSCPKCHKEHTLKTEKRSIDCECGFHLEFEKDSFNFIENEYFKDLKELLNYEKSLIISDVKENNVYSSNARVTYYEQLDAIETEYNKVEMTNDTISLISDTERLDIEIDKVINLVCTLEMSFEIPTPQKTYRIYTSEGYDVIKYWMRFRYLKENGGINES